jgi:methionyl-tRNA formyltransferase
VSQALNLIFCGTPAFAVPTLQKLHDSGFRLDLIVTQPDRPRGRGMALAHSPVKQRALELGLPIEQPQRLKQNDEFRAQLKAIQPDAIIVVGYGRIIPQWMIDLPRFGNINLHASLLPKYRGAAPIQWAIACGESVTGVTTMRIDAGLDTGDVLMQEDVPIAPEETAETLGPRLATIGADLIVKTLQGLTKDTVRPCPQDHSHATFAPVLKKEDGRIDFRRSAWEIWNRLRGFQPWPGAFTSFRGKNLNVWDARPIEHLAAAPGELVVESGRLLVTCGHGTVLELLTLQLEGKKRMSALDFLHGYHPATGERLG